MWKERRDAGETAQWWRTLAALPEDSSSVPNTYVRQLTATCNSSFKGFYALFWSLLALHPYVHMHRYTRRKNKGKEKEEGENGEISGWFR